jgi:hypothetical protein
VVLQLLLGPIATVDHFEQEVISGVLSRPTGGLGSRKRVGKVVTDLHQLAFRNSADE